MGLTRRRGNFTPQKRPDGGRRGPARERGGKAQMTDYVCDCTDGGPLATPPRLRVRLAPLRQAQRGKRMNKLGRVQICCKPYGGEPGRSGRSFAPGEQDHPSCTAGPVGWPWSPPDHRLSALAAFGCLCGGLSTADALDAPASLRGPLRRQARSHVRHLRSILASSPVRVQWIAKLNAVDGRSRLRVLVELRLAGVSGHDKGRSLGPVYGTDLGTNLGVVGLIRPANGGETSPTPHRPAWGLRNMGMPPLQRR